MKNKVAFFLFSILPFLSMASLDTIQSKSTITDVTVFFSGAEVTRSENIYLKKGKQLILVDKLPEEINDQSIQVAQIDNARILSVKHQLDFSRASKKLQREREIEDEIKAQERIYAEIKNQAQVFDIEENLLISNSNFRQKDAGASLSEVKEAADYYRVKLNEIRSEKLKLQDQVNEIQEKIQELYVELNEVTIEKRQTYSRILIAVESKREGKVILQVSYYIPSAGWEPTYNFRVDNVSMPLKIDYNANVYQSSGEDWKNVDVTLSTNNPSLSGERPEVQRWYLNQRSPYYQEQVVKAGIGGVRGRVIDSETGEPLPFANVIVELNGDQVGGSTSDFEGLFAIKPLNSGYYTVRVSYVGYDDVQYNQVRIEPDDLTFVEAKLSSASMALEEVVVAEYSEPLIDLDDNTMGGTVQMNRSSTRGSRSSNSQTYVDGIKVRGGSGSDKKYRSTKYIDNTVRTSVTNMEYKIEIPYSIASDGEDYNIMIKEVTTPAEYIFYAIPKLEKETFLTAQIANWTELDLLSGKANIFYQGTYVSESEIDAYQSSDTLEISLGRDKNVVVQREGNKNKNDKTFSGNTVKETFAWDIGVKNNRKSKIKIIIQDQYPLTEWKSVAVVLIESGGAQVNEKTGFLKWELELEAGAKKDLSFMYSVKYNKGASLSLE